jgi:hypothetical protein
MERNFYFPVLDLYRHTLHNPQQQFHDQPYLESFGDIPAEEKMGEQLKQQPLDDTAEFRHPRIFLTWDGY